MKIRTRANTYFAETVKVSKEGNFALFVDDELVEVIDPDSIVRIDSMYEGP